MAKKLVGLTSMLFKPMPSCYNTPCVHPQTNSFRDTADKMYKTLNSVYLDSADSYFTHSSDQDEMSLTTTLVSDNEDSAAVESVVRGLRSDHRLSFKPTGDTNSILEEAKISAEESPFRESVAMAMQSEDPYNDFRVSMEEMVIANGLRNDWQGLEELLLWYLRVNGKNTHAFIVGAFVDLIAGIDKDDYDTKKIHHVASSCSSSFISFETEEYHYDDDQDSRRGCN